MPNFDIHEGYFTTLGKFLPGSGEYLALDRPFLTANLRSYHQMFCIDLNDFERVITIQRKQCLAAEILQPCP